MSMFVRTGPFYEAQKEAWSEFRPLQAGDEITDGFSRFRIIEFIRFQGKTLASVCCLGSGDINLIGRIGYKSMHFVTQQCWRSSTS